VGRDDVPPRRGDREGLAQERAPLRAVAVGDDGRGGLRIGTPQTLFEFRALGFIPAANAFAYCPHPDGRFLVRVLAEEDNPTINVITHWEKTISDRKVP
jgi:hypothetical protein